MFDSWAYFRHFSIFLNWYKASNFSPFIFHEATFIFLKGSSTCTTGKNVKVSSFWKVKRRRETVWYITLLPTRRNRSLTFGWEILTTLTELGFLFWKFASFWAQFATSDFLQSLFWIHFCRCIVSFLQVFFFVLLPGRKLSHLYWMARVTPSLFPDTFWHDLRLYLSTVSLWIEFRT